MASTAPRSHSPRCPSLPSIEYPAIFSANATKFFLLLHFTFFACVLVSDDGLRASGGCSRQGHEASGKRQAASGRWQAAAGGQTVLSCR